jgi:hypothetical protein
MNPYRTIGKTLNILIGIDPKISHRTEVTILKHNFNTYLERSGAQIHEKSMKSPFRGFLLQPHFEVALLHKNKTANSTTLNLTFS